MAVAKSAVRWTAHRMIMILSFIASKRFSVSSLSTFKSVQRIIGNHRNLSLLAASQSPTDPESTRQLLSGVLNRAQTTLAQKIQVQKKEGSQRYKSSDTVNAKVVEVVHTIQNELGSSADTARDLNYGKNPSITSTALAHSLWSYIIRPGIDTAIDATAGAGGDSLALAELLFPTKEDHNTNSELISIDIQNQACEKTRQALESVLPSEIMENNVQILQTSHAPLPLPRDTSSVALVVYNLGFLPQSDKDCMTKTETTIASLADAALVLRVGGMLSVMTYPRTNAEEDSAVHAFLEGLALFSSITQSWETYCDELECSDALKGRLKVTLQYVLEEGGPSQKWRVHEHKKLGWTDAPILLTATRIN